MEHIHSSSAIPLPVTAGARHQMAKSGLELEHVVSLSVLGPDPVGALFHHESRSLY